MGKIVLILRLAARDLRHRPAQAVLLLLAITAATAVLSLALALHGVTNRPYQHTRAATRGPDVVAQLGGPAGMVHRPGHAPQNFGVPAQRQVDAEARALISAPGVTAHGGPYPVASVVFRIGRIAAPVEAEGRDQAAAAIDQPAVTSGGWVRPGGVVLERTFAEAIGARVGDKVTLNGHRYTVTGIAVTAASAPYPNMCFPPGGNCVFDAPSANGLSTQNIGLAWVTQADAHSLASAAAPLAYLLDLKLTDPAAAPQFAAAHDPSANPLPGSGGLVSWQSIAYNDGLLVQDEQQVLTPGAWLLALLALASVAVLAGGRMSAQVSRVGVLKAVGATPAVVGLAILAENLALAVAAAVAGLGVAWLTAPLITSPGAALVGAPGAPSISVADAGIILAVALAVALASTLVPAIRTTRLSTVTALAERIRPPKRRGWMVALSRRLPVPLLLGLRIIARRPRRAVLTAASVAVTVTGLSAVLAFHALAGSRLISGTSAVGNPVVDRDEQMLVVLTIALVGLAVLNAIVTAWSTVLETRTSAALTRALGASPRQFGASLAVAQAVPALPGALLGVPLGIGLFALANGGRTGTTVLPPVWWLVATVLGTVLGVLALASIPARIGARQPIAVALTEA